MVVMSVSVETWRARIGLYTQQARKKKSAIPGLRVKKTTISLAIKLVIFSLLLVANDIEANPGPTSFTNEKDRLLSSLKLRCDQLEEKVNGLHQEVIKLVGDNKTLKDRCIELETKCEGNEAQSRRENLIFHNLPYKEDSDTESWEESESLVRDHLKTIGLDEGQIGVERCHRLNPRKKDSPIIVKFTHYKDKEKILKREKERKRTEREGRKQREGRRQTEGSTTENQIYVGEDFTQRVRRVRSMLRPFMEQAFNQRKQVRLAYDRLIIDNKVYWYDDVSKSIVDKKPAVLSCLETCKNA